MVDTKAAEVEDVEVKEDNVEEVKESEEETAVTNVLTVCTPGSVLKKALDVLFANTFGNQVNKQIYELQMELEPYINEYNHLRNQIGKDPANVDGTMLSEKGLEELVALNSTVGMKQIKFKTQLPIKVKFLDCFCSNDRVILEATKIAEFED